MKVNIPRVVRPIALSDYAPEFGEQVIQMWVNPPREKRLAFDSITLEGRDERIMIAALIADEEDIERYTTNSKEHEKDHVRRYAAAVLDAIAGVKDLPADEKVERIQGHTNRTDELGEELNSWFAEMWSQGKDEDTHWTAEDVKELIEACLDTDPGLWDFVHESSINALRDYRRQKKASSPGPQR